MSRRQSYPLWGVFAHGFEDTESGKEYVALTFGMPSADEPVLVEFIPSV